ncbi:MAG: FAD-binding protein, partial [Acidimicrobiia bacterium]|nr:FAD-binding protein [Acidimicrobiia bacterium]
MMKDLDESNIPVPGLVDDLIAGLPDGRVQTDADVLKAYSQDRAIFEKAGIPMVLVSPHSTAEVVSALQIAAEHGAIVVPRGAGTGLTGGANAIHGCVIVSMHNMNEIIEVDVINRTARLQPGVINRDLKEAVAAHGLFYPPDPASYDMSSIGGNVATNAGGLCCVKYGVTRDYVVGLEAVLASGAVIRTGRQGTIKNTAGLDLTGLFVGSEGTLGIISEIIVKLLPERRQGATMVAYFSELPAAGEAISDIFESGYEPSLMEILDRSSLEIIESVNAMELD